MAKKLVPQWAMITCGIPQCFVLEVILLLIYINDTDIGLYNFFPNLMVTKKFN